MFFSYDSNCRLQLYSIRFSETVTEFECEFFLTVTSRACTTFHESAPTSIALVDLRTPIAGPGTRIVLIAAAVNSLISALIYESVHTGTK